MTLFATVGSSAEASGHPTNCTEPAPGSIQSTSSCSVTIDNSDIATVDTADIHFDSHAHSHNSDNGCHDYQSHDIDPTNLSSSVSVNGSPVYIIDNPVGSDPTSNGNVDITSESTNTSVSES